MGIIVKKLNGLVHWIFSVHPINEIKVNNLKYAKLNLNIGC